jgi:hypothetical protein
MNASTSCLLPLKYGNNLSAFPTLIKSPFIVGVLQASALGEFELVGSTDTVNWVKSHPCSVCGSCSDFSAGQLKTPFFCTSLSILLSGRCFFFVSTDVVLSSLLCLLITISLHLSWMASQSDP